MFKIKLIHRLISSVLIILSIWSASLFAQPQNETKPKIIFKDSYFAKKDELKLISSQQFEYKGEQKMVGDRGVFLKLAMSDNQRAISMVDEAYRARENGKLLMGLGVAAALVTIATLPYVEVGSTETDVSVTTYYWFPFITIGCIFGGMGYSKYVSLEKHLDNAVRSYNEDLTIPDRNDSSK